MQSKKEIPQRKIDNYFNYYSEKAPTLTSRIMQEICAFGIFFCILGLSWSIPFPHFNFLGQYNSFFNWTSFVIAFSIFYYSKLSPVLSYMMLFLTLIFTYFISKIALHQTNYNAGQLYFLLLFAFGIVRYAILKVSGKNSTLKMELLFVLIGPIWAFHFLLKKLPVKY